MHPEPQEDAQACEEARIEREWLEAGRCGDLDKMKRLRTQHPNVLSLDRKVSRLSSSQTPTFCSWDGFHLDTIGASALHTATWQGNTGIVEYLLEDGLDPDIEDGTGMTPIMLVITHHNLQATRCLFRDRVAIQRNLIMDCRDEDAERNRRTIDRIQLFLRFGADINKRCRSGKSALHVATTDDAYEIACLLIVNRADIDTQDEDGKSPLHHSIQSKSLQITNLLLQHGANLNLSDNDGISPLQVVIHTNDTVMLQLMLNHHQLVPTDQGEDFAGSVLMTAIDEGAVPIVTFLLEESYAKVDYQNDAGETAMHRALLKRKAEVTTFLRSLAEQLPALALRTASGDSGLHYAARYSSPDELQRLLALCRRWSERGLSGVKETEEENPVVVLLNCVNSTSRTALFVAATSKLDSVDDRSTKTRLLLDAGGKLLGTTPFLVANSLSIIALSGGVQQCLKLWLSECAEDCLDDITKFCMEYFAIVGSAHPESNWHCNYEMVHILVSSVHTADVLPLLLSLPFDDCALPRLLDRVEELGRQQDHSLLLALHHELVDAWMLRERRRP